MYSMLVQVEEKEVDTTSSGIVQCCPEQHPAGTTWPMSGLNTFPCATPFYRAFSRIQMPPDAGLSNSLVENHLDAPSGWW